MDVLFEGRLSPELHLKTVLQRVLENKPQGNLLIRISSPYASSNGRLLIRDGRYITAALLDDSDESGYNALRSLLAVTMGNFSGLRPSQDEKIDLVPNLNIELHKVIPLMPTLPESPVGLFDEKSLLDKVFSPGSFEKLAEMQPEQAIHNVEPLLKPVQPQMPVQPQNPPMSQMSAPPQMPMSGQTPLPGQGQMPQLPQFPLSPSQPEIPAWQKDRTVQISKAITSEGEQTSQIRRPADPTGNVRRPVDPAANIRRGEATGSVRRPADPTGNFRRPAEPTGNLPTVPDATGRLSEETGRQPITDNLLEANRDVRRPPPMTSIYEGLDDIQIGNRNGRQPATVAAQYAKPSKSRSASPILVIILVAFLLVGELLAIFFWRPLNVYLLSKNIHLPGVELVHRKPKRTAPAQKHRP